MMKYVNMNEAAFDITDIAFPGLGNCHGVVYVTSQGLYAYHIFGSPQDSKARADMWGSFVSNHRATIAGVALLGACPSNRFANDATQQKAELQLFADAVHFTGPIFGCMWNTQALGWATTYCEIGLNVQARPPVDVRIENFTGQDLQNVVAANPSPADQKSVRIQKANPAPGAPVVYSSCTGLPTVITGVTRMANTPSQLVQMLEL
jgi:hypothetical protein